MKNIKKIVMYAVIVIAVIVCATVVKSKFFSADEDVSTVAAVTKTAVEVQNTEKVAKQSSYQYKANLEAYQQGIVTSKTSAKVTQVLVENGQYVNAGDTLVILDDTDIQNSIKSAQAQLEITQQQLKASEQQLNSAQIALEKIQLNLDDAQRNYDRQKALFEGGAISQADFEAAETKLNSAKADYNSGNATVETAKVNIQTSQTSIEAQKINLEKYQSDLDNTVIKAPISGVISDKAVYVGQMAAQGTALAKVNDISSVYATIQVPQENISNIKVGESATVTLDESDRTYDGTVQNIDLSADTSARVFTCKIKIDNSDSSLYPGTFAMVDILSDQQTEVITIPITALVGSEGNYSVFINDNGTARKQQITIGDTDENNVEVTDGINDGDQVICTNTSTLKDGDEIDVVSIIENSSQAEETSTQNGDSAEAITE